LPPSRAQIETPPAAPTPASEAFLKSIGLIDQLQPLYQLNQEYKSGNPQFQELFNLIEADEQLLKSFRKFANKGWFNTSVQIETPYMAFTRFGTEGFYKIALATFVANGIGELNTRFKIWPHLENTARLTERLATQLAPDLAEDAFVTGILHDSLVAPMDRNIPDYLYFLECALNLDPHVTLFENETHKLDHATVAADLAGALSFENHIVEAVRHHHSLTPSVIPDEKARPLLGLLHIVKRAQILSRLQFKVKFETTAGQKFIREIVTVLDLPPGRVLNIITGLVEQLKQRDGAE
jgi:HD-like signal output (HDOD) protein